jgi:hypothetical protein
MNYHRDRNVNEFCVRAVVTLSVVSTTYAFVSCARAGGVVGRDCGHASNGSRPTGGPGTPSAQPELRVSAPIQLPDRSPVPEVSVCDQWPGA